MFGIELEGFLVAGAWLLEFDQEADLVIALAYRSVDRCRRIRKVESP